MLAEARQNIAAVVVNCISFFVNGEEIIEYHADPDWTLLWYLRNTE